MLAAFTETKVATAHGLKLKKRFQPCQSSAGVGTIRDHAPQAYLERTLEFLARSGFARSAPFALETQLAHCFAGQKYPSSDCAGIVERQGAERFVEPSVFDACPCRLSRKGLPRLSLVILNDLLEEEKIRQRENDITRVGTTSSSTAAMSAMAWQYTDTEEGTLHLAARYLSPRLRFMATEQVASLGGDRFSAAAGTIGVLGKIVAATALDHWDLFRWSDLRIGFLRESGAPVSGIDDVVSRTSFKLWRSSSPQRPTIMVIDRAAFRDTPGGQLELGLFERFLEDTERQSRPLVLFGRQPLVNMGPARRLERGSYGFSGRVQGNIGSAREGRGSTDSLEQSLERCLRKGAFDRLVGALGAGQEVLDGFARTYSGPSHHGNQS